MPQAYAELAVRSPRPSDDVSDSSATLFHDSPKEYQDNLDDLEPLRKPPVWQRDPHTWSWDHWKRRVSRLNLFDRHSKAVLGVAAACAVAFVVGTILLLKPGRVVRLPVHHLDYQDVWKEEVDHCTTWPITHFKNETALMDDQYDDYVSQHGSLPSNETQHSKRWDPNFTKPEGFKIIAMVFYGRARFTDLLDCYLQENLVTNGGFFDEVHFMAHTDNVRDLKFLDKLVATDKLYKRINLPSSCRGWEFGCVWDHATEDDTMYIKIDDDITFVAADAVPNLVQSRLEHPDAFAVSANLVNSQLTGWHHYHSGALYPFAPDPDHFKPQITWRTSRLPSIADKNVTSWEDPPFMGHRWLPVKNASYDTLLTSPFGRWADSDWGYYWSNWAITAQQHYSLLKNVEDETMHKYWFGGESHVWDMRYVRYNANFFAIWGKDVRDNLPIGRDDEQELTSDIPKKLKRRFLIETRSVVGHFHFGPQTEGMLQTDLLDRWMAYANERVCLSSNHKMPMDPLCTDVAAGRVE